VVVVVVVIIIIIIITRYEGPCHHGMARTQVADGGDGPLI
jgi:hypothetical protein